MKGKFVKRSFISVRVCVCVCMCVYTHIYMYVYIYIHTHTHTHIYIYTHIVLFGSIEFIKEKDSCYVTSRTSNTKIKYIAILVNKVIKNNPSSTQFISFEVNLLAGTAAVWPMKGRTRNDQNTKTIQENIH